jgi:cytochrome c2
MRLFLARALLTALSAIFVSAAATGRLGQPSRRPRHGAAGEPDEPLEPKLDAKRRHPLRPARGLVIAFAVLLVASGAAYVAYGYKVHQDRQEEVMRLTGGDPRRGEAYIVVYGCAGCHTVPGITRANGLVGPSLESVGRRVYVGGMLRNTPDNLTRWIVNPREINPQTAMPITGISPDEARDVVAYFYSMN